MFRQQRDLRFTPDKTPYKTRTYGVIHGASACRARASTPSSPSRGLYAGTGYYRLARDQLERFRAAVADDGAGPRLEAAAAAARTPGSSSPGESLRTAPRGYPRDHPRIELLRRKALIAGRALGARRAASRARPRSTTSPARGAPRSRSTPGSTSTSGRARSRPSSAGDAADGTENRTPGSGDASVAGPPANRHPAPLPPPLPQPQRFCMHPSRRPVALLAATVAALAVAIPSTALAKSDVKEYPLAEYAVPADITTGPDGALWAPDGSLGRVWRVTTSGKVSSIDTGVGTGPVGVATGRDGTLWVTDRDDKIYRITTRGKITTYPLPTADSFPTSIVAGPDGALGSPSSTATGSVASRRAARSPSTRSRRRMPGPRTSPSAPTARSGSPSRPPTRSAASPPPAR